MKMNNSLVGKRIAQLRKRRGLSQLMLSEMIDRSPTHLRSAHAFSSLLSDCSEYEKQVLLDTLLATKGALRSHLHLLGKHYV